MYYNIRGKSNCVYLFLIERKPLLKKYRYLKLQVKGFLAPNHPRAKGNIKWYEDQLKSEGFQPNEFRRNLPKIVNKRPEDNLENNERTIYEALCRNEVPVVRTFFYFIIKL